MHFHIYHYQNEFGKIACLVVAGDIHYSGFHHVWEKYAKRIRRKKGWRALDIIEAIQKDIQLGKIYAYSIHRPTTMWLPSTKKEVEELK